MDSYLKNRRQRVKLNRSFSEETIVTRGVPQGSCLGPQLFLYYMNDILEGMTGEGTLYADDTMIANTGDSIKNVVEELSNNIQIVKKNINNLGMKINEKKSEFIIFISFKHKDFNLAQGYILNFGDNCLKAVNEVKYLGVMLDQHMKWDIQIKNIIHNLRNLIPLLYNVRKYTPMRSRIILYNAFIKSRLEYMMEYYSASNRSLIKILQQAQNIILRVMFNKGWNDNIEEDCKKHKVYTCRVLIACKLIKKGWMEVKQEKDRSSGKEVRYRWKDNRDNVRTREDNRLSLIAGESNNNWGEKRMSNRIINILNIMHNEMGILEYL